MSKLTLSTYDNVCLKCVAVRFVGTQIFGCCNYDRILDSLYQHTSKHELDKNVI